MSMGLGLGLAGSWEGYCEVMMEKMDKLLDGMDIGIGMASNG